jgi:hypothetical protein
LFNINQFRYIPNSSGRPYLLSKPISRSHYRICEVDLNDDYDDDYDYDYDYDDNCESEFFLSTNHYDSQFSVNLVDSARKTLKFLLKIREKGIIFRNYEKSKLGFFLYFIHYVL